MEDNPDAGQCPSVSVSTPRSLRDPGENYGETPGRLTDQGDRPQTPRARNRKKT